MLNTKGNPSGRSVRAGAALHVATAGPEVTVGTALAPRAQTTVVDQVAAARLAAANPAAVRRGTAETTGAHSRMTGDQHHRRRRPRQWCASNSFPSQTA